MLTLTIKIIEKPEGIYWSFEPCDQKRATASELAAGQAMAVGIEEAMRTVAEDRDCPLYLMQIDDPRNKL